MGICKDCTELVYDEYFKKYNEIKLAVYYTCRKLDVCFNSNTYDGALKQAEKKGSNPWRIYMQKANSTGRNNGLGQGFDYSDDIEKGKEDYEATINQQVTLIEITDAIISFWGGGMTTEDYTFLENEYQTLLSRFECDSYSLEMLFQEISHQRLDIKKKRQSGSPVDKELKTLQDLLGSANIKPVQSTGNSATEQATFGTLLKKWENDKPIPDPLEEWQEGDWIRNYVVVWFLGHLCKMMGIKNKFAEMYDEEIAKYTVELDEDDLMGIEIEDEDDEEVNGDING